MSGLCGSTLRKSRVSFAEEHQRSPTARLSFAAMSPAFSDVSPIEPFRTSCLKRQRQEVELLMDAMDADHADHANDRRDVSVALSFIDDGGSVFGSPKASLPFLQSAVASAAADDSELNLTTMTSASSIRGAPIVRRKIMEETVVSAAPDLLSISAVEEAVSVESASPLRRCRRGARAAEASTSCVGNSVMSAGGGVNTTANMSAAQKELYAAVKALDRPRPSPIGTAIPPIASPETLASLEDNAAAMQNTHVADLSQDRTGTSFMLGDLLVTERPYDDSRTRTERKKRERPEVFLEDTPPKGRRRAVRNAKKPAATKAKSAGAAKAPRSNSDVSAAKIPRGRRSVEMPSEEDERAAFDLIATAHKGFTDRVAAYNAHHQRKREGKTAPKGRPPTLKAAPAIKTMPPWWAKHRRVCGRGHLTTSVQRVFAKALQELTITRTSLARITRFDRAVLRDAFPSLAGDSDALLESGAE